MHDARAFAEDWIAAWNAHDLDRILSHYAPEVAFLSPVAQKRVGNGRVEGLAALRGYWSGALAAQPGLKFELIDVLAGHACLTVLYRNHRGQTAAETFEFRSEGKVVRSFASRARSDWIESETRPRFLYVVAFSAENRYPLFRKML